MDNNKTLTFLIDLCAQLNIIIDTIFDLLLDKNILSEEEFIEQKKKEEKEVEIYKTLKKLVEKRKQWQEEELTKEEEDRNEAAEKIANIFATMTTSNANTPTVSSNPMMNFFNAAMNQSNNLMNFDNIDSTIVEEAETGEIPHETSEKQEEAVPAYEDERVDEE